MQDLRSNDPYKNRMEGKRRERLMEFEPYQPIPNCGEFRIELSPTRRLFEEYGIAKRLPNEITITPYKNYKVNKYILHQIRRMKVNATKNPVLM